MCGTKLKRFFTSFVMCLLLSVVLPLPSLQAEVVLTDEEAQKILTELNQSEMDLNQSKQELIQVKTIYEQQEIFWKTQLEEEKKKQILPWAMTGTSMMIITILSACLLSSLVHNK